MTPEQAAEGHRAGDVRPPGDVGAPTGWSVVPADGRDVSADETWAAGTATSPGSEVASRRALLRVGISAALAGLAGVLGLSAGAAAKNGDAVRAGERTGASRATVLESDRGIAFHARNTDRDGVALKGEATSTRGDTIGVQGLSRSGDGVAGQFTADGGGTAVEATAPQRGVALRTRGRVQLTERSGISSVSGGAEFVIPVAGGLSNDSIVLATLQSHFADVHVESASVLDVDEGLIVVRLSQAVPEPAKVGWIVLD
jgi:hypothetical protein